DRRNSSRSSGRSRSSRYHAGHEQAGDRYVADGTVNHRGDARRHESGDSGCSRGDRGDERRPSSPTSRKNGIASRATTSTPSKTFCTIAASDTSISVAPMNAPASRGEGHGHAEISEQKKTERHRRKDDGRAHGAPSIGVT